jgi:hypothetical protein
MSMLELDNASRSRKTNLKGGSGLLDVFEYCIRVLGSNHIQPNCLFLENGEESL